MESLGTLSALPGWVWELVFSHNCLCSSLQLSCYDQAKQLVLSTGYLSDNIFTHFVSSFIAVRAPAWLEEAEGGWSEPGAASLRPCLGAKFTG